MIELACGDGRMRRGPYSPRAMSSPMIPALATNGLRFDDLFRADALAALDARFLAELASVAPETHARLVAYRACKGAGMEAEAVSEVLSESAPFLGDFVARLFGVANERRALMTDADQVTPIFRMQDQLVKRRAIKRGELTFDAAVDAEVRRAFATLGVDPESELSVARLACDLLDLEIDLKRAELPEDRARRCAEIAAAFGLEGGGREADKTVVARGLERLETWLVMRKRELGDWMAFRLPKSISHDKLVQIRRPSQERPEELVTPEHHVRRSPAARSTRRSRRRTSAAQRRRDRGARAIMRRQPDVPGTGHRICNDCMKACIFQKQEAGEHPADRDSHPHGRARAAVGLRDLRPAHAVEPAERASPRRGRTTGATCSSWASGPRATRSRTTS
jgi:hypothetical protein